MATSHHEIRLNLGLMGHVDSGKTTLAKALSHYGSTAAFDKHPQSQQRGITLDLGFSAFRLSLEMGKTCLITLVDCPGHASLLRTVLGAASIVDMILLVVDLTKGVQTQTAESLVVAEISTDHLMIVLTKSDLLDEVDREQDISRMKMRLNKMLTQTKFNKTVPMVAVSAVLKQMDKFYETLSEYIQTHGLISPIRQTTGNVLCEIDHCFSIRGQGTVFTGTMIRGTLKVGDKIEIPSLGVERKVKSLQIFKQSVNEASAGDRVGICVTQTDAHVTFERGLLCTPKTVPLIAACIARVWPIVYYRFSCSSRSLFHITIGHETTMGRLTLFSDAVDTPFSQDHLYEPECYHHRSNDELMDHGALIEFERVLWVPEHTLLVISKLDLETRHCRIAFYGRVLYGVSVKDHPQILHRLRLYVWKEKVGRVDRIFDFQTLLMKDMFRKPEKSQFFLNHEIQLVFEEEEGQSVVKKTGRLQSTFGQTGKLKVYFVDGHGIDQSFDKYRILLKYKKYLFQSSNAG
jgi:selenocysteine-specific elongation factor